MTLTMTSAFGYMPIFDESRGGFQTVGEGIAAMIAYDTALPALLAVLILAFFCRLRSLEFSSAPAASNAAGTSPTSLSLHLDGGWAATTLVALPTLASYGFALCLAPWYF